MNKAVQSIQEKLEILSLLEGLLKSKSLAGYQMKLTLQGDGLKPIHFQYGGYSAVGDEEKLLSTLQSTVEDAVRRQIHELQKEFSEVGEFLNKAYQSGWIEVPESKKE